MGFAWPTNQQFLCCRDTDRRNKPQQQQQRAVTKGEEAQIRALSAGLFLFSAGSVTRRLSMLNAP